MLDKKQLEAQQRLECYQARLSKVGMAIIWANRVTRPGPPLLGRV